MWVILSLFSTTRVSDPGWRSQTHERKTIYIRQSDIYQQFATECISPSTHIKQLLIRQQVQIQRRSDGRAVGLQGHTGKTGVAAVKCCVVNPSAQIFVMPQGTSYLQAKEPCVGVDEAWRDASVAAVPVDQDQFSFSHLPGLLHNFRQHAAPHYFSRMISMKIVLHL